MRTARLPLCFTATVLMIGAATTAHAEDRWCEPAKGQAIAADAAKALLEKQGYQVRAMGEEHGCLEAKGMDPKGNRVEVYLDPTDGHIVRVKG